MIYIRKVINTDTGGQVSEDDNPVKLYLKNGCRFVDDGSTCLMTGMKVDENGKDITGQAEYPMPKEIPISPLTPNTNFDNPYPIETDLPF